jgi:hypothetical protein
MIHRRARGYFFSHLKMSAVVVPSFVTGAVNSLDWIGGRKRPPARTIGPHHLS